MKNYALSLVILFLSLSSFNLYTDEKFSAENAFKHSRTNNSNAFEQWIKEGHNLNIKDKNGNSLYHHAALNNNAQLIELLNKHKNSETFWNKLSHWFSSQFPDVNEKNNDGNAPVALAIDAEALNALVIFFLDNNSSLDNISSDQINGLLYATKKGKTEAALYLMSLSEKYYSHTLNGNNILSIALENKHINLAKKIITHNARVHAKNAQNSGNNALIKHKNSNGESAIFYCVRYNYPSLVDEILAADTTEAKATDNDGNSPLHHCFNYHNNNHLVADRLLKSGASINAQNCSGNTPLYDAIKKKDTNGINWFLQHGADTKRINNLKQDALACAIATADEHLIGLFIKHDGDIDALDDNKRSRLMNLLKNKDNDIAKLLIQKGANINLVDKDGDNALHIAAKADNLDGAKLVIEKNQKLILNRNHNGYLSIHHAVANESTSPALIALLSSNFSLINDNKNIHKTTPLHCAAQAGATQAITYLKDHGATLSLSIQDSSGNSPAHCAIKNEQFDVVSLLLDSTMINQTNNDGKTVFHLALEKHLPWSMLNAMISYGTVMSYCNGAKRIGTYLHHAVNQNHYDAIQMLATPALINQKDHNSHTPLTCAIKNKNSKVVSLLLKSNASTDIREKDGWIPLHFAAQSDNLAIFSLLHNNTQNATRTDNGSTAFHIAAQSGNLEIVKYLVKNNYVTSIEDYNNQTPVRRAMHYGQLDVVKFLLPLSENDIINGKIEQALLEIKQYGPLRPITSYVQQFLDERNKEMLKIISMQNRLKHLLDTNPEYYNLLKEQAKGNHADKIYHYTKVTGYIPAYSMEQLKKSTSLQLNSHKRNLQNAITKEENDQQKLQQPLEEIGSLNKKEKEAKIAIQAVAQKIHDVALAITPLQEKLQNLIKENGIMYDLLKQKTTKDLTYLTYNYKKTVITLHTIDQLKHSSLEQLNQHVNNLQNAINKEIDEQKKLKDRTAKVNAVINEQQKTYNDAALKAAQQKQQEDIAKASVHASAPPAEQQEQKDIDEHAENKSEKECGICYDTQESAQRRCVTANCSFMVCDACINQYKSKGSTTCAQCRENLK